MSEDTKEPVQETPTNTEEVLIKVESMDQFVYLLAAWHERAVKTVLHMLTVPQDIEVVIEGEEPFLMTEEVLKGFKMGINLSLSYLGNLPFTANESEPVQH